MSGLNPPLTDISDSGTTFSRITSINCTSDILLDSYPTFSDDFDTAMSSSSIDDDDLNKLSPVCNSNPFLSQTHNSISSNNKDLVLGSLKNDNVKVKVEEISCGSNNNNKQSCDVTPEAMTSSTQTTTTAATAAQQQQQQVNGAADGKPQQKLLLFMNTPENRAKLAGTNFNIINANLLSKISSGSQQESNQTMNLINLKKCIRLNNSLKKEETSSGNQESNVTASSVNATLQSIMAANQQKEKRILPIDILNGHNYGISRKERDSQEIDSGEAILSNFTVAMIHFIAVLTFFVCVSPVFHEKPQTIMFKRQA